MSRSKRYQEISQKVDAKKIYNLDEAIALLKETGTTKFEPSIELHIRLGIDTTKGDQQVRGTVTLPHGTGKSVRIAVFAEDEKQAEAKDAGADVVGGEPLIDEIAKTSKVDFDVAVATPNMMRHMAKVARILGPKGIMPSPKNDTVTPNVKAAVDALKKGKVTFKNDTTGNVHLQVGKKSFDDAKLKENITEALTAIKKAKPASSKGTYMKNISLNATMGPGIRISAL